MAHKKTKAFVRSDGSRSSYGIIFKLTIVKTKPIDLQMLYLVFFKEVKLKKLICQTFALSLNSFKSNLISMYQIFLYKTPNQSLLCQFYNIFQAKINDKGPYKANRAANAVFRFFLRNEKEKKEL